jgi:septal ring factor EnvC (AmiA/AmiB activator)
MKKKIDTSDSPATQGDLEIWGGNLAFQIAEVEKDGKESSKKIDQMQERIEDIQKEQKKQSNVLEAILSSNQMLVGMFATVKDTPERIENHEERITDLEVGVRILQK